MGIYEELGVKTLVNAAGTYTIIGGSKMSEASLQAMKEAASQHVEIRALQAAVHREIAKLTNNEAAVVTAGAIIGVYQAIAACISMKYGSALKYINPKDVKEAEVIMFRAHRNPYDRGLEILGVKIVELGYPNNIDIVVEEQFEYAITDKTVGVLYLPSTVGGWVPPGALDIEKTIAICKRHNIPVIVDAAAQLPPKSNLWHFTKDLGASAVVFSGGKYIKGPQTTGLMLGEKKLLDWAVVNNFPNYGIGRMSKVGREELAGIYTAVKEYVQSDEAAKDAEAEQVVAMFKAAFGEGDIFHFERSYPNEAGQPMARAKLIIDRDVITAEEIREELYELPRAIFSMVENGSLYVNPMMITMEEAEYILSAYQAINNRLK